MNKRNTFWRASWALCCGFMFGCANDVVLGEHVASNSAATHTSDGPSNDVDTHTSSTISLSTNPPFPFPDGGHEGNDDRRDNDRDEPWLPDGSFDGGRFPDGAAWPPPPPGHQMGGPDPFEPRPQNSGEPRPDGDPPNGNFPDLTPSGFSGGATSP